MLLLVLTMAVLLAPAEPDSANPYVAYSEHLEAADAALVEDRLPEALSRFRDAYEVLSGIDRAGNIGGGLVTSVADLVLEADFYERAGAEGRRVAKSLLERHIQDVERLNPDRDLTRVQQALDALSVDADDAEPIEDVALPVEPATVPVATPPPRVDTSGSGPSPGPAAPDPRDRRRSVGISLTVVGGSIVAGGIGLAVGGWVANTRAIDAAERAFAAEGLEEERPTLDAYVRARERARNDLVIAGSVLGSVGAATATAGVVLLVRRRKVHASRARVMPDITRSRAGLLVGGRF